MLERTWNLLSMHFHPTMPESQQIIWLTLSNLIKVISNNKISALESTIHIVPFKIMGLFDRYMKPKLQIFDPIVCD